MNTINFFPWTIQFDYESTKKAYNNIDIGGAEKCSCLPCKNFIANRDILYPDEIKNLFGKIGIDLTKEYEVYHNCRLKNGLHLYGGWFHFVGNIDSISNDPNKEFANTSMLLNSESKLLEVNEQFSISFNDDNVGAFYDIFEGESIVEVYFSTKVPWIISDKEPK